MCVFVCASAHMHVHILVFSTMWRQTGRFWGFADQAVQPNHWVLGPDKKPCLKKQGGRHRRLLVGLYIYESGSMYVRTHTHTGRCLSVFAGRETIYPISLAKGFGYSASEISQRLFTVKYWLLHRPTRLLKDRSQYTLLKGICITYVFNVRTLRTVWDT